MTTPTYDYYHHNQDHENKSTLKYQFEGYQFFKKDCYLIIYLLINCNFFCITTL